MTDAADIAFAGSIPALYDRFLGPLIFEPYAADLAARLTDLAEGPLLEVAAGTGVVTRALEKDRELRYQSAGDLRADLVPQRQRRREVFIESAGIDSSQHGEDALIRVESEARCLLCDDQPRTQKASKYS